MKKDKTMNYTEWNKLISDYFFNEETKGTPINLFITESIIEELASKSEKLLDELNKINKERDKSYKLDEYLWNDLSRAIKCIKGKANSVTIEEFFEIIKSKCNEVRGNCSIKVDKNGNIDVLLILVVIILAISEEDDIKSDNNFYDKVYTYLQNDNALIKRDINNENRRTFINHFQNVFTRAFWNSYIEHVRKSGYLPTIKFKKDTGNDFVGPFFSQCVLRTNQRLRMVDIFERANLSPDSELTDNIIKDLLVDHGKHLFNNDSTAFTKKFNDYPDAFINVFRSEFSGWDGIIRVKEVIKNSEGKSETVQIDKGYIKELKLFLDSSKKLYFCLKDEDRKVIPFGEYKLNSNHEKVIEITKNNQIAYENIIEVIKNKEELLFEQKIDDKTYKLKFTPKGSYFLHKGDSGYTTKFHIQLGGQCLVIASDSSEGITEWLNENEAKEVDIIHDLGKQFSVNKIKSLFEQSVAQLKRKVLSVNNLSVDNKLYASFPLKFSINDINVASQEEGGDCVYMMFLNEATPYPLKYNNDKNYWELHNTDKKGRPIFDALSISKSFKIYVCGQKEGKFNFVPYADIDSPEFICSNYDLIEEYNPSKRNEFGLYDENGKFEGLKLAKTNTRLYDETINDNIENKGKYEEKDLFLFLLSQKSIWSRAEFIENFKLINNQSYRSEVLHNYDRLGFINYEYFNGLHYIYTNKPTLILLPVFKTLDNKHDSRIPYEALLIGARSVQLIKKIVNYSQGGGIKIHFGEINENSFYPQQIKILSNSATNLIKLANKFNLEFETRNNKVVVYCKELISQIGDIAHYAANLKEVEIVERASVEYLSNRSLIDSFDYNTGIKKDKINTDLDMITFGEKYKKRSVLLLDNKQYGTDKHWGNVYMMNKTNTLCRYVILDEENKLLKVNKYIKLPRIISRALVLSTGELPEFKDGYECYKITDMSVYKGINQDLEAKSKGEKGILQLIQE